MKPNICVFFGGSSVEHEVSVISALQAMNHIDREKYNVVPVYIAKNGEMYYSPSTVLEEIERFRDIPALIGMCNKVYLTVKGEKCVIKYVNSNAFNRKEEVRVDLAFPIVHGTNCEDGSLQGFFEIMRVPYIGPDVCASAVGMDKAIFKSVLNEAGIPVIPGVSFRRKEWYMDNRKFCDRIKAKLDYPVIVKPANLGSSVGISIAKDEAEFVDSVNEACRYAEKILVERAIMNLREVNCSVLGDADDCRASLPEEVFKTDAILSYKDKYAGGGSKFSNVLNKDAERTTNGQGMASVPRICPAPIGEAKIKEVQDISVAVFKEIGCSGVCRIDYIIDTDDNDKLYVNEINTIPGSLSFYLWEATWKEDGTNGKYKEMIDKLIEIAYKRERNREACEFSFETGILEKASFGAKGAKGAKGGSKI